MFQLERFFSKRNIFKTFGNKFENIETDFRNLNLSPNSDT